MSRIVVAATRQFLRRSRPFIPKRAAPIVPQRSCLTTDNEEKHRIFREQLHQLQEEREELFGFTNEDHDAWGNAGAGHKHKPSLMQAIEEARQRTSNEEPDSRYTRTSTTTITESPTFTHLTADQKSVHMVDVGGKQVTQRRAVAQSTVILPPKVVAALSLKDWTSKKGPIFDTAVLAGIMAAK